MLDFRVATFLCVCQTMNFTRAAQLLNITQPAVSQHIFFTVSQLRIFTGLRTYRHSFFLQKWYNKITIKLRQKHLPEKRF